MAKFECLSDENCDDTKASRQLVGLDYLIVGDRIDLPAPPFPDSFGYNQHFIAKAILAGINTGYGSAAIDIGFQRPLPDLHQFIMMAAKQFIYLYKNATL